MKNKYQGEMDAILDELDKLNMAYSNLYATYQSTEIQLTSMIAFLERQSGSTHIGNLEFKRNHLQSEYGRFMITNKGKAVNIVYLPTPGI